MCVLSCIVENVPDVLVFSPTRCAVLGNSFEVLEKCWGSPPPHACPLEDIQEVSEERLALNPLCNVPLPCRLSEHEVISKIVKHTELDSSRGPLTF